MNKIIYHYNLHLGEGLNFKDLSQIKKVLRENPSSAHVYLITIASNVNEQLDIYESKYLSQRFYQEHPPYIIGVAKDKGNAISIVEKLMQECVSARGDANIRAYLIGE